MRMRMRMRKLELGVRVRRANAKWPSKVTGGTLTVGRPRAPNGAQKVPKQAPNGMQKQPKRTPEHHSARHFEGPAK